MDAQSQITAATVLNVYFIRHKPTGNYIPTMKGARGGSHYEPMPATKRFPRVFFNRQSAISFLGQWLRGKFKEDRTPDWETGEIDGGLDIEPVPTRIKSEMEIICRKIVL